MLQLRRRGTLWRQFLEKAVLLPERLWRLEASEQVRTRAGMVATSGGARCGLWACTRSSDGEAHVRSLRCVELLFRRLGVRRVRLEAHACVAGAEAGTDLTVKWMILAAVTAITSVGQGSKMNLDMRRHVPRGRHSVQPRQVHSRVCLSSQKRCVPVPRSPSRYEPRRDIYAATVIEPSRALRMSLQPPPVLSAAASCYDSC